MQRGIERPVSLQGKPELRLIKPSRIQPAVIPSEDTVPLLRKRSRETVGSDAFNLEFDTSPTSAEMKRHIISYLDEYRLDVQKHPYKLIFGREHNGRGPIALRDEDRGESLSRKAKRAIASRTLKEQSIHREDAELEGIKLLNEQLRFSQTGDTVFWASPPGSKEEGYGDYGFLYLGKVKKFSTGEASIAMQAIRIEHPSLDQYNAAFSALTGENIEYQHAESFLARPRVTHKDFSEREVDAILQENFSFTSDDKQREKVNQIIKKMEPMIDDFIDVMQTGSREERIKAFYALENYALKLKAQEDEKHNENVVFIDNSQVAPRLHDVLDTMSFKPPIVKGSCGSSEGSAMSNGLTSVTGSENVTKSVFGEDNYGSLEFECTHGHKNRRPRGKLIPHCTTCGESVAC